MKITHEFNYKNYDLMFITRITLIFAFVICIINASYAKNLRSISNINVEDSDKSNAILSEVTLLGQSTEKWVLIIVNHNTNISYDFLKYIEQQRINLDKTVIITIEGSDTENSKVNLSSKFKINPFHWINLSDAKILKKLKIAGTPVTLGMTGSDIAWQISGFNPSNISIADHMNKWNRK